MKNECKHFKYSDEKQDIPNCIVVGAVDSEFEQLIIMNSKECQLFLDKTDPEASWQLMCDSIEHRSGIAIMDGNWELVSSTINGETVFFKCSYCAFFC